MSKDSTVQTSAGQKDEIPSFHVWGLECLQLPFELCGMTSTYEVEVANNDFLFTKPAFMRLSVAFQAVSLALSLSQFRSAS